MNIYCDATLKHVPKVLKILQKILLYYKKRVQLTGIRDRLLNNIDTANDRIGTNLTDRMIKFADVINRENVYVFN